MRSSKVFLLLGLIAAIVLLVCSEVAARDLAETTTENEVNDVTPDGRGGYNSKPDGRGGYNSIGRGLGVNGGYGGGVRGGVYGSIPGGHRGICYYSCCGGNYRGRCRCCASAAEAAQKAVEVKPQN